MADETSDRKSPGFWFYCDDYEQDMQLLPLAAQGLWMRMLCWMHRNEVHRGFLELPTGSPMLDSDISRKVGQNVKEIRRAVASMERIGVFDRDDRGCIMNRRMVRDTHISDVRRSAAMKRASVVERAKHGEFAPAKPPAKEEQTPTVPVPVPVPVPVTTKTEPPTPLRSPDGERLPDSLDFALAPPGAVLVNGTLAKYQGAWFERWWVIYWRKVNRKNAEKAFRTHVKTPERFEEIMQATRAQTGTMMARDPDHRPHGATWLNAERWKDERSQPARAAPQQAKGFVANVERVIGERLARGDKPW